MTAQKALCAAVEVIWEHSHLDTCLWAGLCLLEMTRGPSKRLAAGAVPYLSLPAARCCPSLLLHKGADAGDCISAVFDLKWLAHIDSCFVLQFKTQRGNPSHSSSTEAAQAELCPQCRSTQAALPALLQARPWQLPSAAGPSCELLHRSVSVTHPARGMCVVLLQQRSEKFLFYWCSVVFFSLFPPPCISPFFTWSFLSSW